MSFGHALRIDRTGKTTAHGDTLKHTKSVGSAGFGRMAVVVRDTIGNGWFLAGGQYRIPLVTILTLAGGMARDYIRLALLMGTANHFAAWIHALASATVQVDAERTFLAIGIVMTSGCDD